MYIWTSEHAQNRYEYIYFFCSSVRCFKWRVRTSKQVQLNERHVSSQKLITEIPGDSVTFRSPGFYNQNTKHYSNSMFCLYNISVDKCNHVTVASSSGHTLFNDSKDYLQLYLGHKSSPLFGESVSTFGDDAPTGSLYAVLWSDAVPRTSRGTFELTATCHSWDNEEEGSGSLILNTSTNF